jgi:3-phenylpropionate/trans-cinnamate dioxygenase ferredoxin reductase subunit
MPTTYGCIVIGGGLTAAHVLGGLREGGFAERILLIGDESATPYERPALSKDYLLGKADRESLFVHPSDWYSDNDVELALAEAATAIDPAAKTVTLASGRQAAYDRLVLAMGARPRRLALDGADLGGVRVLRTVSDSEALSAALEGGPRVVVVGAGWIGLEVAAAARARGCSVTVLEAADVPLAAALGPAMGERFAALHRANEVDLRTGVAVSGLVGSAGQVAAVRVGDDLIDADLVLMGVGAQPNTELAAAAGLAVDGGIVVDSRLRTADRSIFAAGDVAAAAHTVLGRRVRVEHWDNAIRQGQLAAASILGRDAEYDWQPYFFTDQYDLGMEYVGLGSPDDEVVVRGDAGSGEFIAFWLRDDAVSAAMNVNVWDVNDTLRGLIGRQVDAHRLADETVELTSL